MNRRIDLHSFVVFVVIVVFFTPSPIFGINFQVYKAVDACKNVLRGLHSNKVAPRELERVSSYTTIMT